MPHIFIDDDDECVSLGVSELIAREGFTASTAPTIRNARERWAAPTPAVVLLDLVLADGSGLELVKLPLPRTRWWWCTGHGSVETAVEALRMGACDYLTKPVDIGAPEDGARQRRAPARDAGGDRRAARRAAQARPLRAADRRGRRRWSGLRPASPRSRATDATVVHRRRERDRQGAWSRRPCTTLSRRRKEPFVPLNCGAVSPNSDRERAVRARAGQLHGRRAHASRLLRAGVGRHAVPRRGHARCRTSCR